MSVRYYCVNNVQVDRRFAAERCRAHPDGLHYFPVWFDLTEIPGFTYQFLGQCDCGRLHDGMAGRRWQEIPPQIRGELLEAALRATNSAVVQA